MASTISLTLTDSEWVRIAEGMRTVAIQFANQGQFEMYISDQAPTEDDEGILIATGTEGVPSTFSAANLPDTAQMWVRSNFDRHVRLIVLSY